MIDSRRLGKWCYLLGCAVLALALGCSDDGSDRPDAGDSADITLPEVAPEVVADVPDVEPELPDAGLDVPDTPPGPKPGVDPAVFGLCYGQTQDETYHDASVQNHNDQFVGVVTELVPDDIEAIQFRVPHPFLLDAIELSFWGTPGPVEVHLWATYGRSWPDRDRDLIPPITADVTADPEILVLDVSEHQLEILPEDFVWVGYVHHAETPHLGLDNGEDDTPSWSRYRSAAFLEEMRRRGEPYQWGAFDGNDYMVRLIGRTYCRRTPTLFADRTVEAGLAEHTTVHLNFGDVDGDNDDDLLLQSPGTSEGPLMGQHLLLNDGQGVFSEHPDPGIAGWGTSIGAFGDMDNDGDLDLFGGVYVPQNNPDADPGTRSLTFLGDGTGQFTAVEDAGVGMDATTASGLLVDYDADGILDLYMGNWLVEYPQPAAMPDKLFRGVGDGTFVDVSTDAGVQSLFANRPAYGAVAADFDNDGDSDIWVANYGRVRNTLWVNQGDGTFVNLAGNHNVAEDILGPGGGNTFGGDFGDYDNDGDLDLFMAEISHPRYHPSSDLSTLMESNGSPEFMFEDVREARGIAWAEGDIDGTFVDIDNDGRLDLFVCTLYPNNFARVWHQDADGTFSDVTYALGVDVHECVADVWADIDRDGDVDLVAASRASGGRDFVYENTVGQDNNFMALLLRGSDCNRSAVGARITLTAGGTTQIREVKGGKGHTIMQSSYWQHIGLGPEDLPIDEVTVRWPCGREQSFTDVPRNAFLVLDEETTDFVVNHVP